MTKLDIASRENVYGAEPPLFIEASLGSGPSTGGTTLGSAGTLSTGLATTSGLTINIAWDSSVNNAPAGFKADVLAAVQYFESQFNDPITITIDVGYGEVDGYALSSGSLGESITYLQSYSYSQLTNAMKADARSASDATAIASLLATNPTGNGTFWVSTAESKALGLMSSNNTVDGYVGFGKGSSLFDYNNGDGVSAGQYDFYDVVMHEISEVMGRQTMDGQSFASTTAYEPLDLFHYSAPGHHVFSGTTAGYFSPDGGTTHLNNFNTNPGGDFGDWASNTLDAFNAFGTPGSIEPVSTADITLMDILGFNGAPVVTVKLQTDTGSSAADKLTNIATLTGTGDPNATVQFNVDGSNIAGTATADGAGAWTFTPIGLADGSHTIIASETDGAGNTDSASLTFTLDTTAPNVVANLKNDTGSSSNDTITKDPTLAGTGGTKAIVHFTVDGLPIVATATAATNGTWTFLPTGLTDGSHTIVASETDAAGNTGTSSNFTFNLDKTAPTIALATTTSTGTIPAGQLVVIDLTAIEPLAVNGTAITLKLNDGGIATYDAAESNLAGGMIAFDYITKGGQNTTDLKTSTLTLGKGTTITDTAGNALVLSGGANKDVGIVVDTNAPTVTAVAHTPLTGNITNGQHVTITLTVKDATAGDTLVVTGTPTLLLNDGATATLTGYSNTSLTFDYTVGNESTTDLKIAGFDLTNGTITDAAGNPIAAIAAALSDLKLTANVFTWAHGIGGDWNTAANWTSGIVPSAGNTALITAAGTYTVTSLQNNSVSVLDTAKTATLDVNSNEFDITGGTGTGVNAGIIKIDDRAKLSIGTTSKSTTFNNTGSVTLNGTSDETDLIIAGLVTLSGAGKIILTDNQNNAIVSNGFAATLTNGNATAGNTISGAGTINDANLTLINGAKGIIIGNGTNNTLSIGNLTNAGTVEGTTANGVTLLSQTNNSGLLEALGKGASLGLNGIAVNNTVTGVVLASGAGAHVHLLSTIIAGGTLKTHNGGVIDTEAGTSTLDGSGIGNPVYNAANLVVTDDTNLVLKGSINNHSTITLMAGADVTDLVISGAVLLTNAGLIELLGANDQILSDGGSAILTDGNSSAANTIFGVGTIGDSYLDVVNVAKGIINANDAAGGVLDINTHSFTNSGLLEATGHGVLDISSNITDTTTGLLKAAAVGAHIDLDNATITSGTVSTVAGSFLDSTSGLSTITTTNVVTNAGRLGAEGGDLTITGAVNNTGVLDANNVHQLIIDGAVTGTGTGTIENNGVLEFAAASSAKITFGDATGTLQLDAATTTAAKFTGTITGFATGTDNIDLGAINYTGSNLISFVENGTHTSGVLTVSDGTHIETLTFIGNYTLADFTTHQDVNNHVDLLHV